MALSGGATLHHFSKGFLLIVFTFGMIISQYISWNKDVVREATFLKNHAPEARNGLRSGFLLFVVSEAMLFAAIFWGFFHSSLAPAIALGSVWPPIYLEILDPYEIPLLNTLILLTSGATITLAHHGILQNKRKLTIYSFVLTIILAIWFTLLQVQEYFDAPFDISDGVYGATFFFATGFHGLHVIIGTIFIIVSYGRFFNFHLLPKGHFGFEAASWYWHFVDVIWLFLFLTIYIWGSI